MKKLIASIYFCLISFVSFGNTTDNVPPVWTSQLPPNITVECSQVPSATTLTATDDSGVVTISFSETIIQGSCTSSYMLTRTWTATDPSGNNVTYSQQINVQDTIAPVLAVSYTPSLSVNCNAIPSVPSLSFTDNCGTVNVNYNESTSAITNGTYTIARTWTVSDDCGNVRVYNQVITVNCGSQIDAVNDAMPPVNGTVGNPNAGNVLSNNGNGGDTLNGAPATINQVNVSVIMPPTPVTVGALVPILNPITGNISVPSNTPAGTYSIIYQICEKLNPTNCDVATIQVFVESLSIAITKEDIYIDSDGNGMTNVGDTIFYNFVVTNIGNVTLTNITVTDVNATMSGGPLATLAAGASDSTTFSAVHVINQSDIDSGQVSNLATATGTPPSGPNVTASSTDPTPCSCNPVIPCNTCTITLLVNTNPLNIGMVGTYTDYNNDGDVNVGDVINYQISLTNNRTTAMTNLTACQYSMNVSGGILASLAAGTSNSTFFTGVHVITQAEINAGTVFGVICICGDYVQNCLDGITTTLNQSNGIKLQAFIDSNSNGIKDASESFFSGGSFNYSVNGGTTTNLYSSTGINYLYETNPATTYNFSYSAPNSYYSCPTTYTNVTVPTGSGITTYNFPITITPYKDLAVYFTPSVGPRPGFNYYQYIQIRNNGNQTISSGTLTFTKDNAVTIATLPAGATASATGFTYNFTNLLPNEVRYIYVVLQVPTLPTVSIGQLLTNTASITIPSGDVNVNNNVASLTQDIRGSYDPNDKQEVHGGRILHSTFTSNDYLTYTIQFENTGNANAINIRVNDDLNTKLDETSLKMIATSHDYVLERVGTTLNWKFNGINLSPSVPNTQTGHGYITFQIKPKSGYAIGDVIPNQANIYFDFNPAIVTNICNTQFVSTLSNQNFAFNNLNYYPNPVKNSLTISNSFTIDEVEISSILGQKMISKKVNDLQAEINLSELSNGVYFVKVSSEGQEKIVKIVKE